MIFPSLVDSSISNPALNGYESTIPFMCKGRRALQVGKAEYILVYVALEIESLANQRFQAENKLY